MFNHASRGFFRFNDILENGQASPWVDWFHIQDPPINGYDESRPPGYRAWWGLHALPKLNTENPEVREYLMQVGERWVARGIDGWRLDVPEEIATEGFWEEFRARVRAVNPDTYIVGEIWREAPDWTVDPLRFDGVMNYPLAEAVLRFAAGDRIAGDVVADVQLTLVPRMDAAAFRGALDSLMAVYPKSALESQLNLLGSHDTPRVLSMVGEDRSSVLLGRHRVHGRRSALHLLRRRDRAHRVCEIPVVAGRSRGRKRDRGMAASWRLSDPWRCSAEPTQPCGAAITHICWPTDRCMCSSGRWPMSG